MQNLSLSIIVPCYNEEKNIDIFYQTIKTTILNRVCGDESDSQMGGVIMKRAKRAKIAKIA